jgi:hypothetical protein
MKKQVFIMVFFFSLLGVIQAQETTKRESAAGIKGGYNLETVSYNGDG